MKNAGSKRIAERYVKALMDVAKDAKSVDAVEQDLLSVQKALASSPELQQFVSTPLLSREQKAKTMEALLGKMKLSDTTIKFAVTLARQQRLDVLPEITSLFTQRAQEARGEMSARIVTASPLSEKDAKDIADKLGKAYGKKINLQVQVDPSLLGGAVVYIGSVRLDSSLSGKLGRLKQTLQAA